jgi:hypothetical protein
MNNIVKSINNLEGLICKCGNAIEQVSWQTLKAAVLAQQITNDDVNKLLCDIKTLLLDVDTPTREQRSDIIHRIANVNVSQLHPAGDDYL